MFRSMWKKLLTTAVAGCAVALGGEFASAQDSDLKALQERLDRLEKQNEELRKQLNQNPVSTEAGIDARAIEGIVSNYLQSQAKKEEAKKAAGPEYKEVGKDLNMTAKWSNGITFESPLKDFKVHVGGRVHYDMGWHHPDPRGNFPNYFDATGFRRARMRVDGTFWEVFNWVIEYDFAGGNAAATDVYIDVTQLPIIGTFRVGHYKEFFSLEELTSSRYITFMDRTLFNEAFGLGRRLGAGFSRDFLDQRATFSAGIFADEPDTTTALWEGAQDLVLRGTVLPIWEQDGRCLLHLGAAWKHFGYSLNPLQDDDGVVGARYRARTLRIGNGDGSPRIIQAGPLLVDEADMYGGEFALVWGPLSIQAELAYLINDGIVNPAATRGRKPEYWGSYVMASYFLTGEHRAYSRRSGAFDRVKVNEPFFLVRGSDEEGRRWLSGKGAWELTARWDYLDLREDGIVSTGSPPTGVLQDVVLGVNWYWTSNAKVMFNYVRAWRDSDAGTGFGANRSGRVDSFGIRFAYDF
ncbi:MAG: OprO/OprP family phosphate-selective porin [Gemmataceae bacterium]|nr:OprO/OprP family phosphate-selective porin [Gemmataceae bacterium]MCI0742449.1 OprO/OprP family phosphate-selective porin [Gemmataceae bacterium]